MIRSSIIYVRSPKPLVDVAIRAWDAGHMSHVGIRVGDVVIDATLWNGVAKWDLSDWVKGRVIVDGIPVYAASADAQEQAEAELFARVGQRYDWLEILGYPLLRDLGDPERPVCSRLGSDYISRAIGHSIIPGRQGRIGPRLLHAAHYAFNAGRQALIT